MGGGGGGGGLLHRSRLIRIYCHHKHSACASYRRRLCLAVLASFLLWFVLFRKNLTCRPPAPTAPPIDRCAGRYVYVHDVPSRFNSGILRRCRALSAWTDMCRFLSNDGLGLPLEDKGSGGGVFSGPGWYNTNQFALEVIFHNRMKQYECLTADSSKASAVYVPFYPGLDVARYLWGYNVSVRDSASLDLVRWLKSRPEWAAMGGKDHFLVAGRITWDFRRITDGEHDWGNKFLLLPEVRNMTVLVIESSPWHGNDFGIPYPTYFHPSRDSEVFAWQDRVRSLERPWLFSFVGAPRPNDTKSIRGRLMEQCGGSARCNLLDCGRGVSKCHAPGSVMGAFESSVFCLQPQGDSYTRRSTFDAMVAGCIPVLFHPGSAYVQYSWHLPRDYAKYSVFISEKEVREGKVRVEEVLMGYSEEEVRRMREEVVGMIPRLVYADPRSKMESVKDAFDVAVEGVIGRVEKVRKRMTRSGDHGSLNSSPAPSSSDQEEEEEDEEVDEGNSWKHALGAPVGEHEWDHFFRTS